jgi:type II secretory pathway component PulJ
VGASATQTRRITERIEEQQRLRLAFQRIAADISGVFWIKEAGHLYFQGAQGISPDGRRDRLEFTSVVFHWRKPDEQADDLVSVAYSLSLGSRGEGGSLIREERPLTTTPPGNYGGPVAILNGVTEVSFSYLDKEKREKNSWSTRASDQEKALPAAVRVTLKIKRGESEREVSALFSLPMGIRPAKEEAAGITGAPGGS